MIFLRDKTTNKKPVCGVFTKIPNSNPKKANNTKIMQHIVNQYLIHSIFNKVTLVLLNACAMNLFIKHLCYESVLPLRAVDCGKKSLSSNSLEMRKQHCTFSTQKPVCPKRIETFPRNLSSSWDSELPIFGVDNFPGDGWTQRLSKYGFPETNNQKLGGDPNRKLGKSNKNQVNYFCGLVWSSGG